MKLWLGLIRRIGRNTFHFTLGGALVFAVAGLAEGALAGGMVALVLLPSYKTLAATVVATAIIIGTATGFISGLIGFALAGLNQAVQSELQPLQFRYQPRDAAFWNCVRSALWASAMLALGGALTGAVCGAAGTVLLSADSATSRFAFEIVHLLIGGEVGAVLGFCAGVLTGALAPQSVQTARQRVKAGRASVFTFWQAAKAERGL